MYVAQRINASRFFVAGLQGASRDCKNGMRCSDGLELFYISFNAYTVRLNGSFQNLRSFCCQSLGLQSDVINRTSDNEAT